MTQEVAKLRVLVLRGGISGEREVSVESGIAVAKACRLLGHHVIERDATPDDLTALDEKYDVVFPVLHGSFGEDGDLQSALETRGVCFVGSCSAASRVSFDKALTKRKWMKESLPTAEWCEHDGDRSEITFDGPYVIKPICQGSSLGVEFVESHAERHLQAAARRWGRVMAEPRLNGPELTVGILGVEALPVLEICSHTGFYDYDAKYRRNDTEYRFAIDLPRDTLDEIQSIALKAFLCLGCRDYGRVDLIVDKRHGPQLLEVNTAPGFTSHSLLPMAAERSGLSMGDLVQTLLSHALLRRA